MITDGTVRRRNCAVTKVSQNANCSAQICCRIRAGLNKELGRKAPDRCALLEGVFVDEEGRGERMLRSSSALVRTVEEEKLVFDRDGGFGELSILVQKASGCSRATDS
jgi:hypothetical protein